MPLQIKSTFFTEVSGISQSDNQSFGPQGSTTSDKEKNFRVSSSFSRGIFASKKKAFAVCRGRAFIQPQTGSTTKVNLILQPIDQPCSRLPIKYFVYRGLEYSSFFHSQNTSGGDRQLITNENLTKANDLVKRAWADFKKFNSLPTNTTEPLLAKWVGYDPANQTTDKLIDYYFYKISDDDLNSSSEKTFELPIADEGYWIGNFSGDFSLDIVLNEGDFPVAGSGFKLDLTYARAVSWTFNTDPLPTGIAEKPYRENILQFIDPAAFWGLHASENGKLIVKDDEGQAIEQTPEQVYTNIVDLFHTKNNLYLYIQSDRTRSYNFYNNYLIDSNSPPDSLKWGVISQSLSNKAYLTNKWPLIIENASQNHNNLQNEIYLQLVTDNNRDTMLYGQTGDIKNAVRNNFINASTLLYHPEEDADSIFTKEIILTNPSIGSPGQKKHISTLHYLIYHGKKYNYIESEFLNEEQETIYIYAQPNYFDDTFDFTIETTPFETQTSTNLSFSVYPKSKIISQYPIQNQQNISTVQTVRVSSTISTDDPLNPTQERITYLTEAIDVLNNPASIAGSITVETKLTTALDELPSSTSNFTLTEPYYYKIITFTDGDNDNIIKGLTLHRKDKKAPNKILLGISKEENDFLETIIQTNTIINPRIALFDILKDNGSFISTENISYFIFNLGIIGDTGANTPKLFWANPNIFVYSLDRYFHFTTGYSKYLAINTNGKATIKKDL